MTKDRTRLRLDGRAVLITGAARGLGAAYAADCAGRGAELLLTDVDAPELEEVAQRLRHEGAAVTALPGDVSDPEFVDQLASEGARLEGTLSGWVNNAGIEVLQPADQPDITATRRMVEVNLLGSIYGTAAAARAFTAAGGSIVNVTSGAQFGIPHLSVYGATKGGITSLTLAAAQELAGRSIRVNAVSPVAGTRMSVAGDVYFSALGGRQPSSADDLPEPRTCASLVTYLLCDASAAITGQILRFDGRRLAVVRGLGMDETNSQVRENWTAEDMAAAFSGALSASLRTANFESRLHGRSL